MTSIRRLALASTVATFILVAIGGLVRATKSGLGCGTHWPDCAGAVIPFFGNRAVIIEFSHRLMATVVVILLGVLAVAVWRQRDASKTLKWTATTAFFLVLFQAVLGAIVVWLELKAESVVLHLATAMTLVAVLIHLSISTAVADGTLTPKPDAAVARKARLAALGVLVLLLVGSYVTGRSAGYVFSDWPLMNGKLIPDLSFQPAAIHFLHRALAGVVGVAVFAFGVSVARRKDEFPRQAKFAHAAMGLFGVQVLLGALNVWNPPPGMANELFVSLHLLTAALIWGCLVAVSVLSHPSIATARNSVSLRATAAYEGGA
ncbi:MAG: heme o synthase [Actinomycetota bacterium]|jgi:cytochrome c oxidase assembly protein subunit 15|nr:heme o synthase [Actinomycetota bacterium]